MQTKRKYSIVFDFDGVIANTTLAVTELHYQLTGELPKAHYSTNTKWNMADIINADEQTIDNYFENDRLFDLMTFIGDKHLSMKDVVSELVNDYRFEVFIVTKGSVKNIALKYDWIKANIPNFNMNNLIGVRLEVEGKPDIEGTIFIDDYSHNFNGKAKYNILFRNGGVIADYNKHVPEGVKVCNSVTCVCNMIADLLRFEKCIKS